MTPTSTTSIALSPNTLKDYCPNLQVGDVVYLNATTTGTNKYIYLDVSANLWNFGTKRTITQNDLDSKVYWYASGTNTTATILDIMISTDGGDYVPYEHTEISATVTGKNLFDRANAYVNFALNWGTGENFGESGSVASLFIPTKVGDKFTINYSSQIMYYDKNKDYLGCLQSGGTTIAKTTGNMYKYFTTPNVEEICYKRLGVRKTSDGGEDKTDKDIMLNREYVLEPYEEYKSNSLTIDLQGNELCSLPNGTKDEVNITNGEALLIKRIGKVVLDENSAINFSGSYGGYYRLTTSIDDI